MLISVLTLIGALCGVLPGRVAAQVGKDAAIFGQVTDKEGKAVSGVIVTLQGVSPPASSRTTLSGERGVYRLEGLVAGRYRLRAERLGYTRAVYELELAAGERRRLDLRLRVDTVAIEGVVVEGKREDRERARFEEDAGITARVIGGEALKTLPGLAEADVLRAVEVLPGVVSTSDFSSAFNVRGGSADQNLILLDGFPVFNPFHLGGLFSVFNSDVIARAELLAGGFGAEYGGRVSSVLNVETEMGAGEGLSGDVGVSLLAARAALRGPLPRWVGGALGGEGGSAFVSARRSYFDQILPADLGFPYHLTDLQAGATILTRGGGHVRLTGYTGSDVLDLSDFAPPGEGEEQSILRIQWDWGNDVAGILWEQPFGRGWTLDARLGYSHYSDELGLLDFDDTRFSSRISQYTFGLDLGRELSDRLSTRVGVEANRLHYRNLAAAGGTEFFSSEDRGTLGAAYASISWRPSDFWIVEPGLRADAWWGSDSNDFIFSPRFAVKRFLGPEQDTAVKFSAGRYVQFLHSLRDEDLPVSNDSWILADRYVPYVTSDQVQLGVERYWGEEWYASAEAYLRGFRGVVTFNVADDPNDPADDYLEGTGRAYGLDLQVRRSTGRLTGWIALSLLKTERTFPDPLAAGWTDRSPTVTYAPIFDRRLDADLVLHYRLPWDLEAGARWNYGSPLPYTRPIAQHLGWGFDLGSGRYQVVRRPVAGDEEDPSLYVVLGPRNAERYPAYHRLDLTLRREFTPAWGTVTPYLQVLNVYNQRNVLFYFYNYDRTPPTRSGISMFPTLPAIGMEVSF